MKSKEKKEIILTLTISEAQWLKGIMQNPMHDEGDPIKEDSTDKEMRTKFWNTFLLVT